MSKYGVIPGPYFPAFGLNTDKYLSVFSPNAGKYGPEKTPYLDTFHVVLGLEYSQLAILQTEFNLKTRIHKVSELLSVSELDFE